jgi:hypothetical protein
MKLLSGIGVALFVVAALILYVGFDTNPTAFSGYAAVPFVLTDAGLFSLAVVSLGLSRSNVSVTHQKSVMTTILIIGTLLVPATLFFAPSYTGCLGCNLSPPLLVTGSITVPSNSGNGTLTVQIRNAENKEAITAIALMVSGLSNTPAILNASALEMMYQGTLVSPGNPLPVGQMAVGSVNVENMKVGTNYAIQVSASLQNGFSSSVTITITTQV